jgi:hypothetical protein
VPKKKNQPTNKQKPTNKEKVSWGTYVFFLYIVRRNSVATHHLEIVIDKSGAYLSYLIYYFSPWPGYYQ